MRKKFISAIVLLVVAVGVAGMYAYDQFYGPAVAERMTIILRGDESYEVMTSKIKRYIDHDWAFDVYARHIDLDRGIEPGAYTLQEGMNVVMVARTFKFGTDNTVRITINNLRTPEALALRLAEQIDADAEAILVALHDKELQGELGFTSAEAMFSVFIPNTYEVYRDIEPAALVRKMKQESDAFWGAEHRRQQLESLGLTPYEVMTLASIVHEETNVTDEMPRIAGVYLNRLRRGMPLQADPTVKYAVGDPTLTRILYKHLEVESPYNTYKYVGLPPTPIAMPDVVAIEAVLNYERHDYLYFCARAEMDGRHNFARTHREHERNAAAYHDALSRLK